MQDAFYQTAYHSVKDNLKPQYSSLPSKKKFEYAFYGYYFGEVAYKYNLKIESFFGPCIPVYPDNIFHKEVSIEYLDYFKKSPLFIDHLKLFLEKYLLREVREEIYEKVSLTCVTWQKKINESGPDMLVELIDHNFKNNSNCKLIWTVQEVKLAIDQIIIWLNKE